MSSVGASALMSIVGASMIRPAQPNISSLIVQKPYKPIKEELQLA